MAAGAGGKAGVGGQVAASMGMPKEGLDINQSHIAMAMPWKSNTISYMCAQRATLHIHIHIHVHIHILVPS